MLSWGIWLLSLWWVSTRIHLCIWSRWKNYCSNGKSWSRIETNIYKFCVFLYLFSFYQFYCFWQYNNIYPQPKLLNTAKWFAWHVIKKTNYNDLALLTTKPLPTGQWVKVKLRTHTNSPLACILNSFKSVIHPIIGLY